VAGPSWHVPDFCEVRCALLSCCFRFDCDHACNADVALPDNLPPALSQTCMRSTWFAVECVSCFHDVVSVRTTQSKTISYIAQPCTGLIVHSDKSCVLLYVIARLYLLSTQGRESFAQKKCIDGLQIHSMASAQHAQGAALSDQFKTSEQLSIALSARDTGARL